MRPSRRARPYVGGIRLPLRSVQVIEALFERQVRRTPRAVACLDAWSVRTYEELDRRSARLAGALRGAGVGNGECVAVCVPRSCDMLAAWLAAVRAGGVYVPIDVNHPLSRQRTIVEHCGARVLLTDVVDDGLAVGFSGDVFGTAESGTGSSTGISPSRAPDADCPLAVIYTSGTTGTPKGVRISARSVLNRLEWMWRNYPFRPGDVSLMHRSCAVIGFLWDAFGPLLRGVPSVIADTGQARDPRSLCRLGEDHGVTHLSAVPSVVRTLLDAGASSDSWPTLQVVVTGGEPVPVGLVDDWRAAFPGAHLLNVYGATEASAATAVDLSTWSGGAPRAPVGRPLDGVRVYVVDADMQPVPTGAVGHVCLAGACLASGYLHESGCGATGFRERPASMPETLVYLTGDSGRLDPDGSLEVTGRIDQQVKVRGFRVEPEEVEAQALTLPAVRGCAVVQDAAGDLVAFVAVADAAVDAVQRAFEERLPFYAVPSRTIAVDHLPRLAGGKIDRVRLTRKASRGRALASADMPGNDIERRVLSVWQDVLGLECGMNDPFLTLGGNSLKAMQLAARTASILGERVTVAAIFEHSTARRVTEACVSPAGLDHPRSAASPHGDVGSSGPRRVVRNRGSG